MKRLSTCFVLSLFFFFAPAIYADDGYYDAPEYSSTEGESYHPQYSDNNDGGDYSAYQNEFREPAPVHHYHHHIHHTTHHASLPATIPAPGEPVIIVNPRVHAWGAYTTDGKLLRTGLATAGSSWCRDLGRPCRTKTGTFRINSLGSASCVSKKFPIGRGGAPMPYCMFFNGGQGIHGSYELAYANLSHGCVRISVEDAKWLRFNFTHVNTKIVIEPY